jgi:hypothetical protein
MINGEWRMENGKGGLMTNDGLLTIFPTLS